MSEYTPTTDEMRAFYTAERLDGPHLGGFPLPTVEQAETEFDRWLAAHDAEVRAEARHEFCDPRLGCVVAEEPEPSTEPTCEHGTMLTYLCADCADGVGAEPQGEPSEHRDRIALAEFIDKALDGDAGYGVGEFLAGGILSFLSERTALHAAFEPQGEPSDAHLSNVSIDGVQQSWKQLYEREHEQHLALQGYRRMLSDLDRNASGRHEGDYDSHATGNGGISAGNPHLTTGQIIGYDIGGREYVVPEPRDRGTLSAWVRAAGEAGGEGR
ncbi:hypothetical protein [Microbacterium sp. H6]|uniref:hypothetical protein n=1 Tax=Microbacterium sp. H6 TaxID=421122 RepID=UPI000DE3A1F1|nr:hypothetical protein [Microbacterium sp. H6]RBO72825.1 hypothetical protein DSP71_08855 [Microbacterium sp. H6]